MEHMALPLGQKVPQAYFDQDILSTIRIVVVSAEGVVLLVAFVGTCVFAFVLHKSKTIHRNLRAVWYNMVAAHIIITITRSLLFSDRLAPWIPPYIGFVANILHDLGIGLVAMNQLILVIERGLSTYLLNKYTNQDTGILFPSLLISSAWLLSMAWSISYWMGVVHSVATVNIMLGIELLSAAGLSWILWVSRNQYKMKTLSNGNSLATRHTISENLRAAKAVKFMVSINVAVQIIGVIILLVIVFAFLPRGLFYEQRIAANVFDLIIACNMAFFPIHLILAHPELWRIFSARLLGTTTITKVEEVRNVNGQQLIHRETPQQYFSNLRELWDKHEHNRNQ